MCSVFMVGLGEICCDNVFDVRDYTTLDQNLLIGCLAKNIINYFEIFNLKNIEIR